jgi:hypothetical protein
MSRLRPADWLAGAAGALLLATLFLPWYDAVGVGTVSYGPGSSAGATAWRAFSVIDVLLALLALLAIALPVVTAVANGPAKPVALAVLSSLGSILAVLLVLFRLIDSPVDGLKPDWGAWLGLLAALLMLAGCWGAMRDERTPGAVAPDVPRRPAP